MEIKTVSIIGLGALGVLFGHKMAENLPFEDVRVIADENRIKRYEREKIYCNEKECRFHYVTPQEKSRLADLVIFFVKFNQLPEAIEAVRNQVGEKTVILSALNGISSEEMIGRTYGMEKLLYCVAQGMDAVKVANRLTYEHMGILSFGEAKPGVRSERAERVAAFFDKTGVPYELVSDMKRRMWGKFMLNVGLNQVVAATEGDYGTVQKEGAERELMLAAMREVILLSEKEGVNLTKEDLNYWMKVLSTLNPEGKPSMRQDLEAGRRTELELFAGTVIKLGEKNHILTPVNHELYRQITQMEKNFK